MAIRKIISRSIGVDVIAAEDLAAGSVQTAEIQNGVVTGPKLADNLNYDSGTLYLDSTNNRVGVGTASPLAKLHTYGADVIMRLDDTNGGISFIGHDATGAYWRTFTSDTLRFMRANGTENMRIDANGNVGIGNPSPGSFYSLADNLVVGTGSGGNGITIYSGSGDSGYIGFNDTTSASMQGFIQYNHNGDYMAFAPNGTEKMRIDSSGNVGIGATPETTFAQKKVLRLSTTASLIAGGAYYPYPYYIANNLYYDASDNLKYIASSGGALLDINAHLGGRFTFYTAPAGTAGAAASLTERMRISNDGHLLVGIQSNVTNGSEGVEIRSDFGYIKTGRNSTGTTGHLLFFNPNGNVGSITTTGSNTAYNTSSDYRLKENVEYDFDATTRLKQLKPARFNFIADADKTVDGFLAHEVQDIVPEAITGIKDGMRDEEYEVTPAVEATYDDDGNILTEEVPAVMGTRSVPDYQGIDQGKLVPLLVKSLQEALTKIETLESRLNDAGL